MFQTLKEGVLKYSVLLKWIQIIGWLIISLGLLFFLGIFKIDFEYSLIGAPINSLYGITYVALYAFGGYLVFFALLLLLPVLDREYLDRMKSYLSLSLILSIVGGGLILYSLLVAFDILPSLASTHKWVDYFILGLILFCSNYITLIFSTEDFHSWAVYDRIWFILIGIGITLEIMSLLAYWSLLKSIQISPGSWGDLYSFGLVFLFLGGFPFLLSYKPTNKTTATVLGSISIILIISGLITYLAPTLALNGILFNTTLFKYNKYFDFLFYGSLLLISGISVASTNKKIQRYFKTVSSLWIVILFFGLTQYLTSILMEITDTHFIDFGLDVLFQQSDRGSLFFGMTWNVFFFNGFITTLIGLIVCNRLIIQETAFSESTTLGEE